MSNLDPSPLKPPIIETHSLDGVARGLAWTVVPKDVANLPLGTTGAIRFRLSDIPDYSVRGSDYRSSSQAKALQEQINLDLNQPLLAAFDFKRISFINPQVQIADDIVTLSVTIYRKQD